jgi:hypothetical protein
MMVCPAVAFSASLPMLVSGMMLQAMGLRKESRIPAVARPPQEVVQQFNLSPFYKKFVSAGGIPSSGREKPPITPSLKRLIS